MCEILEPGDRFESDGLEQSIKTLEELYEQNLRWIESTINKKYSGRVFATEASKRACWREIIALAKQFLIPIRDEIFRLRLSPHVTIKVVYKCPN